jgi:hypothetical protein
MFSGYIVAVSFVLQIQYGIRNMPGIISILSLFDSGLIILLFVIYFILLIKVPKYFGEFATSFIKITGH